MIVCEKIWVILIFLYGGGPEVRLEMLKDRVPRLEKTTKE